MDGREMDNPSGKNFRSGFVTFVGRPNVGKSSIINALLREKVAAVSSKPQTTRNAVRCILSAEDCQIVIVDTPGLHKPRHALGEFMMREAKDALSSVDAVCLVTEAGRPLDAMDEAVLTMLEEVGAPILLAANKIDLCGGRRGEENFWRFLAPVQERVKPVAVVPVSARDGTNLDVLKEEIAKLLPEGAPIYPEDVLMDATERFLAEEIIREKIFEATEQEVPHSVAVIVEEFKSPEEYPDLKTAEIRADIIVERPGQKGILIGGGGAKLKAVGSAARREMEERFGYPVFLQLWVKVKPDWRKSSREIERAGYRRR
ncbi:MAG: GTPase Era [Synergistaceae bacterium]|jgi:GTP-binding protein Era|nr:GTPase Era [Synergistaceae bacterium]